MRVARASFSLLVIAACSSRQAQPVAVVPVAGVSQARENPPPEIILLNHSWEDPELAARGLGRLEVSVRAADRPAQAIVGALVSLRIDGRDARRPVQADQRGVALFDSVAVGRYELLVRAIGYGSARAPVPVAPGCRTDVEAYIGIQAIGIAPPPPEPGRVRITTCRPAR
jgi:hypothetical protein